MKKLKKVSLVILWCVITSMLQAQITKVNLQASGLTCSMCNLSIKKSLEKITFIDSIIPDVETATYEIKFKENAAVNLNEIKEAVTKAGFSVAKFVFYLDVQKVSISSDKKFEINGTTFNIFEGKIESKKAIAAFQIIDKGFISDKTFKKYKGKIKATENVYHLIQTKEE